MKTAQTSFLFATPVVTAIGGGDYRISAGKPVEWLPTSAAAKVLHCDKSSLRRWIAEGWLPWKLPTEIRDDNVIFPAGTVVFKKAGFRKYVFRVAVVQALQSSWTDRALAGTLTYGRPKKKRA